MQPAPINPKHLTSIIVHAALPPATFFDGRYHACWLGQPSPHWTHHEAFTAERGAWMRDGPGFARARA